MTTQTHSEGSLTVGAIAPDFTLPYATKEAIAPEPITLSAEYPRGPIVLAFYPGDWSGGCTIEVCTFRDSFKELETLGIRVWGVSGDYKWSHYEWAKHHDLPFALLSDHDHAVAKAYDSYDDAKMYNRRTIFVIGRDGRIAYMNLAYNARESSHFEQLKTALATLK